MNAKKIEHGFEVGMFDSEMNETVTIKTKADHIFECMVSFIAVYVMQMNSPFSPRSFARNALALISNPCRDSSFAISASNIFDSIGFARKLAVRLSSSFNIRFFSPNDIQQAMFRAINGRRGFNWVLTSELNAKSRTQSFCTSSLNSVGLPLQAFLAVMFAKMSRLPATLAFNRADNSINRPLADAQKPSGFFAGTGFFVGIKNALFINNSFSHNLAILQRNSVFVN